MNRLFRNSEVIRSVIAFASVSAAAIIGTLIYDAALVLPVMLLCAAFTAIHLFNLYLRYRRISMFAADVDIPISIAKYPHI